MKVSNNNFNLKLLLLITLMGAFLRIASLGKQSIWLDEAFSFFRSQKNIHQLWTDQYKESNPPLFDSILHYYLKFSGKNDGFDLRFVSAIIGILIIPLSFIVGRRMFNQKVGLLFASLISISPYHIYYSQDAKMYSLLSFLSLLSFFIYYLSLERGGYFYWVSYVVVTILLIYCHSYGSLLFLTQILIAIIFSIKHRNDLTNILLSFSLIFICSLPRFSHMIWQVSVDYNPWIVPPQFTDIILTFKYFSLLCWHMQATPPVRLSLSIGLPVFIFILAIAVFAKHSDEATDSTKISYAKKLFFILSYLTIPILIAFLISLRKPIFVPGRYDMSVFPAFCLLVSLGLDKIKKIRFRNYLIGVILLATSINLYNYYFIYEKSNDRKVSAYVQSRMNENDIWVFTEMTSAPFYYYSRNLLYKNVFSFPSTNQNWLPRLALDAEEGYVNDEINKLMNKLKFSKNEHSLIRIIYTDLEINRRLVEEMSKKYALLDIINFRQGRNDVQCSAIYIFK